ncbi:uncharacterized protein LOC111060544 isoform X1 [Nilaparvata lugens]|uniref:uncharacterized protein LOC111060544 isoform X1 n=1 Tax=Nilaparvata lugens TaxID=108931 RepID=UPI00193E0D63|nr:uncharacterized protein LOC111060544 isoform X1 [Nilaparvata lugens]
MYNFSNDDDKRITNTTTQQKKCTPCSSRNDNQSNSNKTSFTNIEARRPQDHPNMNLSQPSFNLNPLKASINPEAIRRPSNTTTQVRNPSNLIPNMRNNCTDLDKMRFGNLSRQSVSKTCAPTSFKSDSFPPQTQVMENSTPLAQEGKTSFPENISPFQGGNSRGSTNLASFENNMNLTSSTNLGKNSTLNPVSHEEKTSFLENIRPFQGNLEIKNSGSSNLVSYGNSMNPLSIKMGRNSTSNPVCDRNNMNSTSINMGRTSTSIPVCEENSTINPSLTSNNMGFNGNKNPTVTFKCPDFDELIHAFSSSNQEINKSGKMQNNRGKTAFQIKKLKESDFDELMRTLAEDNYFSDTCSESSNYLYSETVKEEMKKLDKLELEFSGSYNQETTKVPEYDRGLDNRGEVTNVSQYNRGLNDNTFLVDDTKLNKISVTKVPGYDAESNKSFSVNNNSKVEGKITNNSLNGAGKAGKLSGDCCRNSAQNVLSRSQINGVTGVNLTPMSQTGIIMSQNRVTGYQDEVTRSQNGDKGSLNVAPMGQTGVIMSQNRVTGSRNEVARSQNGVTGSLNVSPMSQTGAFYTRSQTGNTWSQSEVTRSQNGVTGSLNVAPMSLTGAFDTRSQTGNTRSQSEVTGSQNGVTGSQTGAFDTRSQTRNTRSQSEVTRNQNGVTRGQNGVEISQNVPPRSKDYDELIQAFTNEINGYNNQGAAKFSKSKSQFDEKGGKLRGSCCKISNEPKTLSGYDKLIEIFSSRTVSDNKLNEKVPYQAPNRVQSSKTVLNPENLCIPERSDVMKSLKAQQNNVESKVIVDQESEGSYLSTSTTQNSEKSFDCGMNELLRTFSGECNSDFNNMTIDDPRCQKCPSRKSLKSLRENRKETEKCENVEENEEIKSDNLPRTKSEHVMVLLNQLAPTPLKLIPIKKKVNKEELPLMSETIKCALKQIKEVDKKAGDLFLSLIGKERQCTNIRKQKRLQNSLRRRSTERNVTCQNQREKCRQEILNPNIQRSIMNSQRYRQEILNPNIQRSIMNSQRFLQRRAAKKYSCKKDLPIDC